MILQMRKAPRIEIIVPFEERVRHTLATYEVSPTLLTLHPKPYTLHLAPHTLFLPRVYTLNPKPYTLDPTP
jgi:hypothetical protein